MRLLPLFDLSTSEDLVMRADQDIERAYLRGFAILGLVGIGVCWALWHFVLSHVHLVWQ